jgi:Tfp pilus assembly protein PilV
MSELIMSNIDKKNNSCGLTLIEVLISMAILMIGIFAVMSMLSTAAKGNAEARKMVRALNIAEEKMEEFLYGNGECYETGKTGEYDWEMNNSTQVVNGTVYCNATVTWTSYGKDRAVFLETLRSDD